MERFVLFLDRKITNFGKDTFIQKVAKVDECHYCHAPIQKLPLLNVNDVPLLSILMVLKVNNFSSNECFMSTLSNTTNFSQFLAHLRVI